LWRVSDDWRSKQSEIADALQYCIVAEPTWSAPALLLGEMYESLNDLQSAEDVYRRVLAKNSAAIQVANRLTGLLLAQNKLSDPDEVLDLVKASSDDIDSLELKMALVSGDLDLAIRELKDRMSDGDNNASELIVLARLVYAKDRNLGEAQEHLAAAEAVDPNSTALVAAKVAIYRADGKDREARKVLDDYVTKMGDFNAYLLRAKYLAGEGELEDAEKDYQKLTSFAGRNAVGYRLLGDFYIANQDYNKAMEALENGLDANPEDLNLQRALMNALFRRDSEEDRERALDILGKLEEKLPRDIELMRIRASLLLAESTPGSIEKAKEKLERIVELEPRAVDAHLRLIDMAMKRGDLEDARHLMIQALGSNSNNSMLLSVRSKIELMAGDKQRAVELARLAIPDLEAHCQSKDRSSNIDAIVLLAQMYRISGDLNAAKQWIEQAEQLDPDSPTVIDEHTTLASTFYQKSDAERAKQIYQNLCDQYSGNYPHNLRIFNDLAWILQEGDSDYVSALDLANKGLNAARQDSEKLHLLDTRGTILFKMGRFAAAKKDFEALVSISPPDSRRMAKALLHLGRTCSKLNQLDRAKKHLTNALEIDRNLDMFTPEERSEIDRLMK
jgi:tetratricopeptide (TPR) repeat protein